MVEGNSGTTNAVITLTATQPLSGIPVQYTTVDGTAVAGSDFPFTSGTVWFWGELVKQITIPIHGDPDVEPDEKLTVHLSSFDPRVTLLHPDVDVSIVNDDAIEFTLPSEYGGGIARLYGTVESGPRQKRAVRLH